jgi:hypothetical protein
MKLDETLVTAHPRSVLLWSDLHIATTPPTAKLG